MTDQFQSTFWRYTNLCIINIIISSFCEVLILKTIQKLLLREELAPIQLMT